MPAIKGLLGLLPFLIGIELMTLWSCASPTMVQGMEDSDIDLAQYRSFAWLGQQDARALRLNDPRVDYITVPIRIVRQPSLEDKVRTRVEEDLRKKGYVAAVDGNPDFYVTFYGKAKDQDWVSSWEGMTSAFTDVPIVIFPGFDRTSIRTYREGVVYLTFYDAKSKRPSWTGSVESSTFGSDFGSPELSAAVDQLVTEFKKAA